VVEESDGDLMGDGVNIAARLEGIAKPGGICLSDDAYRQVRDRLKETFIDLGEQALKNIARPVRVYAVRTGAEGATPTHSPAPERSAPPRLSIVVLPFAALGGDASQDYFADGVTESLTTDLSCIAGSFVIGCNTAFTYKGRAVDLKQIGRELNVCYVLEGSVQRSGNRLRVNVQLIDAESGTHLWADRFEKPAADLFDMQDEIVARLANALNAQLITAEARRAERAPNPDSMDLYFQGMVWANKGSTPEYLTQAHGFFERALALDPCNVEALVGLAAADVRIGGSFMTDDRSARFVEAETALTKALTLAPEHAPAHFWMGVTYAQTNRAALGIAECERALALDRNLAGAHTAIGLAKITDGRPEQTEAHVADALRLSPRDNRGHVWMSFAGVAKFHLGKDDEALACFRRAIEMNRNNPAAHFYVAAIMALHNRLDEARFAVKAGLAFNPTFTISRFRAGAGSDNPTYLAQRERACDGLRMAGVPEK
jgi:TolB-like protein